jgi:phage N-6-adenine-methyltransferase
MVSEALFTSNKDEWSTPQNLFDQLNQEFHFILDPCCTKENAKCGNIFTKVEDGLKQDWNIGTEGKNSVFVNPPFSKYKKWIYKAYEESKKGCTVVCLIASRTDTHIFHDVIIPYSKIRFIKGRLKFGGSKNSAPFPSLICIFTPPQNLQDKFYQWSEVKVL